MRRRNSIVEAGGNFGAPPKPPCVRSNWPATGRGPPASRRPVVSGSRRRGYLARPADGLDELRRLGRHVAAPLGVRRGHGREDVAEGGHPVPRRRREVRTTPVGLPVRSQEHRHRPAALAGERDDGLHVDAVHVGALLAVDLDVDEALVHEHGRLVVLERLVLHHVAPVACGVPDREQNRPVRFARAHEGFVAPRVPVDRVVRVLEEVRAGLTCEPVHTASMPGPRICPSFT